MEIKKGLVEWNGRRDIPCTYAELEDGTKYYFRQDLVNGNHIVTTSLLEAVDENTKPKSLGLLDTNGNLLIPCNNTSFIVVNDDLLFVEPTEPISENVKEANVLRMDPLSTTRLVTTAAQIKERIPSKDFLFYNQFSEVTPIDANGNKLMDEYFSFVARDGDKLYMAKNNIDTDIIEFSTTDKKVIEKVQEEVPAEVSTEVPSEAVEISTEPVTEVVETPVEAVSEPVIPSLGNEGANAEPLPDDLSNIFGEMNDTVEEKPKVEEAEVDYSAETEIEKALKESNEKVMDNISYLNQLSGNNEEPAYEFNSDFKADSIDRTEEDYSDNVENNDMDTEKDVVDDVSRILGGFGEILSKKEEDSRMLQEENATLKRENVELRARQKEMETGKNHDAMTISSLEDELEEYKIALANLESENQKLRAKIETLEDTNDLYKRREEETRRKMKTLTRAYKIFQAAGGMMDEEEVKVKTA